MTKIAILTSALALFGASGARADDPVLTGSVGAGDSFAISLAGAVDLQPGTYTLLVHDHSAIHNFHLFGPGVDVSTTIEAVGDQTFTVTLLAGKYFYVCDEHPTTMKGSFTVGAPVATTTTTASKPKPKHHAKPKKKKKK